MNCQLLPADRADSIEDVLWIGADNPALAVRVEHALRATGYLSLRNVEVSATGSAVHLQGSVSTYYLKQLAQATVLNMPDVCDVCNDIDVILHR